MKSLLKKHLLIIPVLLFIIGCESSETNHLIGKWAYVEFKMNEESVTGDRLGNPTMEFKDDGTYEVEFGPMAEEGEWTLEGDEVTTMSKTHGKTNKLTIVEQSEERLVFEGDAEGNKVSITLVPYVEKKIEEEEG